MTKFRLSGASFSQKTTVDKPRTSPRSEARLSALPFLSLLFLGTASAASFEDYTYTDDGSSVTITKIADTASGVVEIPSAIPSATGSKPVTAIAPYAFYFRPDVTEVIIPPTVISVGTYAFSTCASLNSVSLPSSVTTIGAGAFYNCGKLTAITVDATNPSYASIDGALFSEDLSSLILFPPGITGGYAVPEGVTTLEKDAFNGCTNLTGVTLPESVTTIGDGCFYNCKKLATLSLLGDKPTVGRFALGFAGADVGGLTIYYASTATGHSVENWGAYTLVEMPMPSLPSEAWLLSLGQAFDLDMEIDTTGDGVSLLMAYALNLDPTDNLSGSMPQPVNSGGQMSLEFFAGRSDLNYSVETCGDLESWTNSGVNLSAPDGNQNRTATIPIGGGSGFMRLNVTPLGPQ